MSGHLTSFSYDRDCTWLPIAVIEHLLRSNFGKYDFFMAVWATARILPSCGTGGSLAAESVSWFVWDTLSWRHGM